MRLPKMQPSDLDGHPGLQRHQPSAVEVLSQFRDRLLDRRTIRRERQKLRLGDIEQYRSERDKPLAIAEQHDDRLIGPAPEARRLAAGDKRQGRLARRIDQHGLRRNPQYLNLAVDRALIDWARQPSRPPLGRIDLRQFIIILDEMERAVRPRQQFWEINARGRPLGIGHKNLATDMNADGGIGKPGQLHLREIAPRNWSQVIMTDTKQVESVAPLVLHGSMDNDASPLAGLPSAGKLLGLDLGTKTIGVAVSDGMRYSATPLETIARIKFTQDAERLKALIAVNQAVGIVLGLPLNMDGSEGPRAQSTRAFARNLSKLIEIPIAFWDERLSTSAVTRTLIEADVRRDRRAQVVDKLAASYILQGALERLRRG